MRHPTVAISLAVLAASLAAAPLKAQEGGLSDLKDFKLPGKAEAAGEAPIAGKAIGSPAASEAAQGAKAPGVYSMGEVSGEVDIAESSLRVLLNEPASGKFPASMTTDGARFDAAVRLLNVELRRPGLLRHEGFSDWKQFQAVRRLFRKLEEKHGFYYNSGDAAGSVDIAESSLRIILDKPASGKFPKAMLAGDQKLAAALRLLNIQLRFPGLLEGKHSFSFAWSQYEAVTALFRDFEKRWELFR